MAISIYYSAKRPESLTDVEKDLIKKLISEYSVQQEIENSTIQEKDTIGLNLMYMI